MVQHAENLFGDEVGCLAGAPADKLWRADEGRLQRCRAGVDHGRVGKLHYVVGAVEKQLNIAPPADILFIIPGASRRSAGHQHFHPYPVGHFHAHGHGPGYLRFAGSGQNGDVAAFAGPGELMPVYGVHKGVAFVDKWHSVFLEIRHFEGKDYEEAVHPCLEFPVAASPGCPCLGRDIVEHPDPVPVAVFRNPEVESRIVDRDHYIRLPLCNVSLAKAELAKY